VAPDAQRERAETSDGRKPRSAPKYVTQSHRILVREAAVTRDSIHQTC